MIPRPIRNLPLKTAPPGPAGFPLSQEPDTSLQVIFRHGQLADGHKQGFRAWTFPRSGFFSGSAQVTDQLNGTPRAFTGNSLNGKVQTTLCFQNERKGLFC